MTPDEILKKLETRDTSNFQRKALQEAIKIQDDITPALLDIISFSANNPNWLEENYDYMGFTYALYLLAQFREKQAYPLIIKYVSQLSNDNDGLNATGDLVTEDLCNILASVCNGDLSLIKQLIENPEINDYVRSAALRSLVVLYKHESITRTELIAYFTSLFDTKLEQRESYIWTSLANCCYDIHPEELHDKVFECFDKGYIESFFISQDDITYSLQQSKEETLAQLQADTCIQLISDVITTMENWACFRQHRKSQIKTKDIANLFAQDGDVFTPQKRQGEKVGRNDPCPCGSGKKYKKCCLH